MSSGVAVNQQCIEAFQTLKLGKSAQSSPGSFAASPTHLSLPLLSPSPLACSATPATETKYIVFKLSDDNKEIVVEKTSESADYDEFTDALPPNTCRYAVYDFEFEIPGEGKRNKICFFAWSPDESKIKDKMLYASSKDALRRSLVGIATEIQGTDFSEIGHQEVLDKVTRK
ncbi:hypothetical protein JCM11251_001833 [Rhodosporidiobolus azoricus]